MPPGPRIMQLQECQPVGGAISSRPFCLASGPSCVTDTAAITSKMARQTNTVFSPYPFCTHRIVGMMKAVASRPTPAAQPKPDARALVGNTSDAKICIALPATCTKKVITNPATMSWVGVAALAKTIAMTAAPTNATTDVLFRPNLSSAYIIQMLAHGTAKFIQSVYSIDLVIVKPFAFMMFGNHAPRPMATPKNAVKQIMPATTRVGNMRKTTPNGSLLVLLAASLVSEFNGGVEMPRRPRTSSASWPRPCVDR